MICRWIDGWKVSFIETERSMGIDQVFISIHCDFACLILADVSRLIADVSHTHVQRVHRMHGDFSVISHKLTY